MLDKAARIWPRLFGSAANRRRTFVIALAGWMGLVTGLVLLVSLGNPIQRAVVGMAWGLILIWIAGCGLVMWRWREAWCRLADRVPWPWPLKFVIGCTLLALLEEAVTTLMTNCAPLFGLEIGQAYITASANYFDVVLYHSVVVFVPMFIAWSVMLRWWRFSPFAVFLLFGLTGLVCESVSFGLQNLAGFAFWIFVYGLMVWLPAHWPLADRTARPPPWWAYPLAVVLPFVFLPIVLVIAPWIWLTPEHPKIHFPPIRAG
jgi:hypothetical protein